MTHAAHCGGLMSCSPSLGLSSYRRRQTTGSLMTLTPFSLLIHHQLRLIQTPYRVGYTVQGIAGTCSHVWASSLESLQEIWENENIMFWWFVRNWRIIQFEKVQLSQCRCLVLIFRWGVIWRCQITRSCDPCSAHTWRILPYAFFCVLMV